MVLIIEDCLAEQNYHKLVFVTELILIIQNPIQRFQYDAIFQVSLQKYAIPTPL